MADTQDNPMNIPEDKKFEALIYRHEDQAKLLQFITSFDDKLYAGFLALQLTFGGFLTQYKMTVVRQKSAYS